MAFHRNCRSFNKEDSKRVRVAAVMRALDEVSTIFNTFDDRNISDLEALFGKDRLTPDMCTRFYIEKENAELKDIMEAAEHSSLTMRFLKQMAKPLLTSGEIRPTDLVPVIASNRKGERSVFPMKWGFSLPKSNSPVVNARVETASEKPLFREHWQKHRCIVPSSWYYEWNHFKDSLGRIRTGDKYLIQPSGSSLTFLCGVYRFEEELPVFAILTREPSKELSEIHDRMPLILPKDKIEEWIRPDAKPETLLPNSLTDMIKEKAEKK